MPSPSTMADAALRAPPPGFTSYYRVMSPDHPVLVCQVLRDMDLRLTPYCYGDGTDVFAVTDRGDGDLLLHLVEAADEVAFRAIARSAPWGLRIETEDEDVEQAVTDLLWNWKRADRPVANTGVSVFAPGGTDPLRTMYHVRFDDTSVRKRFLDAIEAIAEEWGDLALPRVGGPRSPSPLDPPRREATRSRRDA